MTNRHLGSLGQVAVSIISIAAAYVAYMYFSGALSERYPEPGATYALIGYLSGLGGALAGVWNSSVFRVGPGSAR